MSSIIFNYFVAIHNFLCYSGKHEDIACIKIALREVGTVGREGTQQEIERRAAQRDCPERRKHQVETGCHSHGSEYR